jgi:hypothetical protein
LWQVTSQGERGESRTHIVALAIASDGQRLPAWERSADQLFRSAESQQTTTPPVERLVSAFDVMLHRELGHRQIISQQRGYEARMIGWLEIVGPTNSWDANAIQSAIDRNSRTTKPQVEETGYSSRSEDLGLGEDVRTLRALSVRQPFAEAIVRGVKRSEIRTASTSIRGRILIYASLGRSKEEEEAVWSKEYGILDVAPDDLPRGVIVGTVELYGCSDNEWLLRNPQRATQYVEPTNRPNPVWFYPF